MPSASESAERPAQLRHLVDAAEVRPNSLEDGAVARREVAVRAVEDEVARPGPGPRHRRRCALALPLVSAAVVAPSAPAMDADSFLNSQPAQASHGVSTAPRPTRVVQGPSAEGFDWADAGIGAAAALATLGLGGAVVLSTRRRHSRPATTA
jgi:hypothetical protein